MNQNNFAISRVYLKLDLFGQYSGLQELLTNNLDNYKPLTVAEYGWTWGNLISEQERNQNIRIKRVNFK